MRHTGLAGETSPCATHLSETSLRNTTHFGDLSGLTRLMLLSSVDLV